MYKESNDKCSFIEDDRFKLRTNNVAKDKD